VLTIEDQKNLFMGRLNVEIVLAAITKPSGFTLERQRLHLQAVASGLPQLSEGRLPSLLRGGYSWGEGAAPVHPYPLSIQVDELLVTGVNWSEWASRYARAIIATECTRTLMLYGRLLKLYNIDIPERLRKKVAPKLFAARLDAATEGK
jgi:hypothetical protein